LRSLSPPHAAAALLRRLLQIDVIPEWVEIAASVAQSLI
jgi:hypothetical protein